MDTILYTYQAPLTRKEAYKYCLYFYAHRKMTWIILLILFILSSFFSFLYGLFFGLVYWIFLASFYFLLLFIQSTRGWLKVKNRNQKKGPVSIIFYQEYLELKDVKTVVKVSYDDLDKIVDMKTSFYIMFKSYNGFVIRKEECEPGLISFITDTLQPITK